MPRVRQYDRLNTTRLGTFSWRWPDVTARLVTDTGRVDDSKNRHQKSTQRVGYQTGETMERPRFSLKMIAPCGMNCGICKEHLRQNNPCSGCYDFTQIRPKSRDLCPMRNCEKRNGKFCFDCGEYPCKRLAMLDKRYRTKYGMSEIENLDYIRDNGIRRFIEREHQRWVSDRGVLCVHDKKHYR